MKKYLKVIHIHGVEDKYLKMFKKDRHHVLEVLFDGDMVSIPWPNFYPIPPQIHKVNVKHKLDPIFILDKTFGDKWEILPSSVFEA
jgi:hypothetical protein